MAIRRKGKGNASSNHGWKIAFIGLVAILFLTSNRRVVGELPSISDSFAVVNSGLSNSYTNETIPLDTPASEKTKNTHEENKTDPLALSKKQQIKFDRRAPLLSKYVDQGKRYDIDTVSYGANIITDQYASLHIWKSGGTTVAAQTNRDDVSIFHPEIQKRKWFTLVRDPIDHFLSGWAECGDRVRKQQERIRRRPLTADNIPGFKTQTYDQRIKSWLGRTQQRARRPTEQSCEIHSLPQGNYLMVNRDVPPQLEIVADLRELPALLRSVGFPFNPKAEIGRNSSANEFRNTYYPRRKDLISNTTMRSICEFVAIDYFLFDFDLPNDCQGMEIFTKWNSIESTTELVPKTPEAALSEDTLSKISEASQVKDVPRKTSEVSQVKDVPSKTSGPSQVKDVPSKASEAAQGQNIPSKTLEAQGENVPSKSSKTVSKDNPEDNADSLALSKKQQIKFDQRAILLSKHVDREKRYDIDTVSYGANIITDQYASLHIWKSGGTTVAAQTNRDDVSIFHPEIQKRKWFTFVRDPIDHFLSGWAECGDRSRKEQERRMRGRRPMSTVVIPGYTTQTYDQRIKGWLGRTQQRARRPTEQSCEIHSLPQGNYLMVNRTVAPQLEIVADLRELPALLRSVGFLFNPKAEIGRNSSEDEFRNTYYPRHKDKISDATMRSICEFVAIDYFLFDFDLPDACQGMEIFIKWKDLDNSSL